MSVPPNEKLARFIFSKKHFSVEKREVKFKAFTPPSNSDDISVYRISGLSDSGVWEIGREYVQRKDRTIKARANLSAEAVYANNLEVVPDTLPHELHANIRPFPADRRARDRIAKQLALASQLVIMPTD
jgi:hypothetical protein